MQFVLPALVSLLAAIADALPIRADQTAVEFPTSLDPLGSTATGAAPMLVQTDTVAAVTGIPKSVYNNPQDIEKNVQSFDHKPGDRSIQEMFSSLSPYYVSDGFGVYNYGMPGQCRVKQVHYLSRHGSRYADAPMPFVDALSNSTFNASGNLEFLNKWQNKVGKNILVTLGNKQLFDKGAKTFFQYGGLYDWDNLEDKIVVRSTSQERMTKSALYFLNGFFGLDWEKYAFLELLVEDDKVNNTLAAWNGCANNAFSYGYVEYPQLEVFKKNYLTKAAKRINKNISGFQFTPDQIFQMQTMCAYETSSLGASKFCPLFSQKEWENYEYYQSADWYVQNSFGNSMGRALGIGWVEEFKDRLLNTTYSPSSQATQNSTIDENPYFFPLDQSLYFDFTHDSSIINIITALGFEQFKANWTFEGPQKDKQFFDISKITPFAAQMSFEIIECDEQVPVHRDSESVAGSSPTQYVHLLLNDNTLSLSKNIPKFCEDRVDGWCKLDSFLAYLDTLYGTAQFANACAGKYNYTLPVTNGVPN